MRKYLGIEVDENYDAVGYAQFVSFGWMADGTTCYHKIVDGEEDEDGGWYSCVIREGKRFFIYEGC